MLLSQHQDAEQWGSQIVALNGITQSFTLPLTISYAMVAVMTMRSGDFPGYVACPYWSECTKDTIMITPDYETNQGYTGTGKSTVTWILLAIQTVGNGNKGIQQWYHDMGVSNHRNESFKNLNRRSLSYLLGTKSLSTICINIRPIRQQHRTSIGKYHNIERHKRWKRVLVITYHSMLYDWRYLNSGYMRLHLTGMSGMILHCH